VNRWGERVVGYPDELARRYRAADLWGTRTIADELHAVAAMHPHRDAVVALDGRVSYRELDERSDVLAVGLAGLGLVPGDPVLFQATNRLDTVLAWYAVLKAGLVPVCTLAAHRGHEIGEISRRVGAVAHLVEAGTRGIDLVEFAQQQQEGHPTLRHVLVLGDPAPHAGVALTELGAGIDPTAARVTVEKIQGELEPDDVAVFQLSGGTTGVPKIIPRFQNDYVSMMRGVVDWMRYGPEDVSLLPTPMMHNLHMGCSFGPTLLAGGTVVIAPNVLPETLIGLIQRYRPTWNYLGGPILARLEGALRSGDIDLSGTRGIISPNSAAKLRVLTRGAPVYHTFGMTEGVVMFTRRGDPQEALDQTNGRPTGKFDRVRILKPGTEEDVSSGEMGECVFKGPCTIRGYYDAAERDRETFTSDGWYRSGDLMSTREIDGTTYYVFRGRTKDVVSRGGEKINSEEVEWACVEHPAIAAAAVVAMPDPVYEERVCAFVIARSGRTAPGVVELGDFLRQYGLAKYKWPERIEVVSEFPVTSSGKLSKPLLKQMIAEKIMAERGGSGTTG
jgi:2,3-dihydroxybenzoate-AMP ligase